jgi:nucleoside 2-deoxyribosyltransferase
VSRRDSLPVKVFLSAALTNKLTAKGVIETDHRRCLETIIQVLQRDGHEVSSAHVREQWGANIYDPEDAVYEDLVGIQACDVLVVLWDDTPTFGVPLEMGLAIAWGKPIVQLFRSDKDIPYLDLGLRRVVPFVPIEWSEPKEGLRKLRDAVRDVVSNPEAHMSQTKSTPR